MKGRRSQTSYKGIRGKCLPPLPRQLPPPPSSAPPISSVIISQDGWWMKCFWHQHLWKVCTGYKGQNCGPRQFDPIRAQQSRAKSAPAWWLVIVCNELDMRTTTLPDLNDREGQRLSYLEPSDLAGLPSPWHFMVTKATEIGQAILTFPIGGTRGRTIDAHGYVSRETPQAAIPIIPLEKVKGKDKYMALNSDTSTQAGHYYTASTR